jgi:hypothetical protein
MEEYTKFITDEKRGALAEYVTRRKAVIDLFEKFLEYKEVEKQNYQKEDAIHRLICPMRVDSHQLEIEDHNLWLLDDRLAFFHYFASDKAVKTYTGVDERVTDRTSHFSTIRVSLGARVRTATPWSWSNSRSLCAMTTRAARTRFSKYCSTRKNCARRARSRTLWAAQFKE